MTSIFINGLVASCCWAVIPEGFYPGSVVFVVAFLAVYCKGLDPFFFLINWRENTLSVPGCIRRIKTRIKGRFAQI